MLRTFTARHIATQVPAAAVTASRRPADPHRGLTVGYGRCRRQPLPGPARSGPVMTVRGGPAARPGSLTAPWPVAVPGAWAQPPVAASVPGGGRCWPGAPSGTSTRPQPAAGSPRCCRCWSGTCRIWTSHRLAGDHRRRRVLRNHQAAAQSDPRQPVRSPARSGGCRSLRTDAHRERGGASCPGPARRCGAAARPATPPRSRMPCCGSPGSPMISRRSASWISTPSSPGRTASGAWTCGCGSARQNPGIPSCAGCCEHAAAHRQPAARAAGHTVITAWVQGPASSWPRRCPGSGPVRPHAITGAICRQAVSPARCGCAARRGVSIPVTWSGTATACRVTAVQHEEHGRPDDGHEEAC